MPGILIIKPSSLGDIVHGLQVAETLRNRLGGVRISWIAARPFAPLVRACATVAEVIEFDRHGGLAAFVGMVRELRQRRYDFVLDMQGLARSGLMTAFAPGARKIGRSDAREAAGLFYPETVPLPPAGHLAHPIEILLRFLTVFGLEPVLQGQLRFALPAGRASANTLTSRLPSAAGPLFVFFPSNGRPERDWPGYGDLTRRLLERAGPAGVVWAGEKCGAPEDLATAHERFVDLTGTLPVDEWPGLIARAAVVVANDSGPMHLAAAMGVPVLGIFGPTDPRRSGPYPPDQPRCRSIRAPDRALPRLESAVVLTVLDEMLRATQTDRFRP
jgi:heptosyltransferase I